MDFKKKASLQNPREHASLLSKLLFLWIVPLFKKGLHKDLSVDDMYDVPQEDLSQDLGIRLGNEWEKQRKLAQEKGKRPSFFCSLWRIFGVWYTFMGLAVLVDECVIRVAQPIFLRLLIRSFNDQTITEYEQYWYAFGVCILSLFHALMIHPLSFEVLHIGMKCRVSACSLIYRKTLSLSKAAQEAIELGQLQNLIGNDVTRFDMNLLFIPYLIIAPIQTMIFVYFLWEELGVSCLAGVGLVFLLMPLQYYIGMLSRRIRFKIAEKSDERCRIMNEILTAIRVIKMYAWEKPFSSLVDQIRRNEVKVLRKRAYLRSFYLSLFLSSKKFIPYLTFLAYVVVGHTLTADKVFFAVTIFDIIIANMVSTLPSAAAGVGELAVAIKRIENFLLQEEKVSNANLEIRDDPSSPPYVKMKNVCAWWTPDIMQLDGLNLSLTGNKLVMIVGPVGSGKSSFLQALLGDLQISSGKCFVNGQIVYSIQDPWIFCGTLKQNILFGKEFDEELYDEIVSVCALESDFNQFPEKDETYVGERGITLSGGQKARLNLARALYKRGNLVLLDDPISAVDSRVSRHIFDKCIKQYLAGTLRILVTHQLQYLPQADHIIVMKKGKIFAQGTYKELVQQNTDFVQLMTGEMEVDLYRKASLTKLENIEQELKKEADTRESQKEKMASGSISFRTYWDYFRSGGSVPSMIFVFLGFIVSQMLYTASDYWLSHWTNEEENWSTSPKLSTHDNELHNNTENGTRLFSMLDLDLLEDPSSYLGQHVYIVVYSILIILIVVVTNISSAFFFRYCMKISVNIHNRMFKSIVNSHLKFFDENPSGRVMNRFSRDLCSMDESLPAAAFDVITILLIMLGVIVVVIISNYYVSAPSVFLIVALWFIRQFYIETARDVKRIEAISRSPLYTHLTASMQGLTTIRALQAQNVLIRQFDENQNTHSSAWFLFISSNRWFGIWLEMISVSFLALVTFGFLFISRDTNSGFVGLAISSILSVTFRFQWGMRQSAEMENLMVSVQRCFEFVNLPSESSPEPQLEKLPQSIWPSRGRIQFKEVTLSYDGKIVLNRLSFEIEPQQKIGIVGRTGAGKSSVLMALFRLSEPDGDILIDSVPIKSINLHTLRKHISIIPQEPVLFSGSVRYNLDPFGQFTDDDLWRVLNEVRLCEAVTALDMKVNDGGTNFSVGQRQLVCLARAILRSNKILVMDEATANVDPETDSFIQQTIREKFVNCTILTIAHRLHTVMDYCDKILVLDGGKLVEFDHPWILLQDTSTSLYRMAQHTGKSSLAFFKQIAEASYKRTRQDARAGTENEMCNNGVPK